MGWILPCPRRLAQSSCSSRGCNHHPELRSDRGRSKEKRRGVVCLLFLHLSKIAQTGRTAGAPAQGHARPAYEPISPAAHPPYRDGCVAADQQLGTPLLCRGGPTAPTSSLTGWPDHTPFMSSSCSSNLRPLSWKEAGANWKSSSLAPTPSPRVRRP